MSAETVMGFDFGTRNIGIAVGQTVSRTAEALVVVSNKHGRPDWDRITRLVSEWKPDRFVVGLPSTADGTPSRLQSAIERFAAQLQRRFERPASFCDERLSSYAAEQIETSRRLATDAVAAQMILQTWFEQQTTADSIR